MPTQSDLDLAYSQAVAILAQNNVSLDTETPIVPRRTIAEWEALRITTPTSTTAVWDSANLHPYGFTNEPYALRMDGDTPVFEPQRWENVYQVGEPLEEHMYMIDATLEIAGLPLVRILNINTNNCRIVSQREILNPIGRIRL